MVHRSRLLPALWANLLLSTACLAGETVLSLAPREAVARVEAGEAVLVDVREPAEWVKTGVVADARLLPLSDLRGERTQWAAFLKTNANRLIVLYCRTGNRSGQAAQVLAREGFRVANAGGLRDWTEAGYTLHPPILAGEPTARPTTPP